MAIDINTIAKLKQTPDADKTSAVESMGRFATPDAQYTEKIDTMGEAFSAGIQSGVGNIQAQNQNFLAAIDTLRGKDTSAANRLREGDFLEDQSSIPLAGLEQDFASSLEQKDVHGFFLNFASATGQFIPSLAASLAEAAVVGGLVAGGTILSGGTATPGLVAAAGVGTAARRKAVEGGVRALNNTRRPGIDKMEVEDLLHRAYQNQTRVNASKRPLHKFTPKELDDLSDIYGVLKSNMRGKRFAQGAVLGAFTQEQRMGTGIAFSDYADQGMDTKQNAINSLLQGTAFGAIGVGSEVATLGVTMRAFKRPGRVKKSGVADPFKFDPIPKGSMFKDFTSIAAVSSLSEGIAESLQEELSVQQKFRIDADYTKAQAKTDRVNALFAGLMGGLGVGGGLGSGTAVMNKVRNLSQRNVAERNMARIFGTKENAAALGVVMGERAGALETQFDFMKNENSGTNSVFVPIEAKAEFAKVQSNIENMFGPDELITVSTPIGALFTTDQRVAGRLANLMDSGYKYDTGVIDGFLSQALGYSRTRDSKDDIVVGVFDNEKNEFVKYQSASENIEGDFEAAENAMKMIRASMDPKRYTIEVQSLAQHRRFRQEGLPKDADVLKAQKQAFQTEDTVDSKSENQLEQSDLGTSDDDTGVEGDRGQVNLDVTAANIDVKRGNVTSNQRQQFDAYIREEYGLPIDFNDLVLFVNETPNVLRGNFKALGKKGEGTKRTRYAQILNDLKNAEKLGTPTGAQRAYLQRINKDGIISLGEEMQGLLDEIAEEGTQMQQSDSISSSIARDEFGSRSLDNVPLVGVSEVLNRTNVVIDMQKPDAKDYKSGRKDKKYLKDLAIFNQAQKEAKAPIKEQDPLVMAKKGSGTAQNPFVNPKTDKGFQIGKDDKKADGRSINGLNTYIHTTLKEEFNEQKPFLSQSAVETFRDKAKIERENTQGIGFLRFVEVRDLLAFRTATAANESFVAPARTTKTRRYVIVRMKPDPEQFREITRENVEIFRNIRADLQTRLTQANKRTQGKGYNTPIHFKLQNLNTEAKSQTPVNVDMAVLLEGITTLSKVKQRRQPEEYTNQAGQRLAALLDSIDILQENNFKLVYYPQGVTSENALVMTDMKVGRGKPDVALGVALDHITSTPDGPGAGLLKITFPKKIEGDFQKQVQHLRKEFGLTKLARNFFSNDKFAKINVPLIDLVYNKDGSYISPGMDKKYLAPLLQDLELTDDGKPKSIQDLSLNELEALVERAEDAISVRFAAVDTGMKSKASGELKELYGDIRAQDRTILQFISEAGKIVNAINKQDIRSNPGQTYSLDRPLGQPASELIPGSERTVKEAETKTTTTKQFGPETSDLTGFETLSAEVGVETSTTPAKTVGVPSEKPKDGVGPAKPSPSITTPGQESQQIFTEKETAEVTPGIVEADYKSIGNVEANYKPNLAFGSFNPRTGRIEPGIGGLIDRDAQISTYIDDIAAIDMENQTPSLDETGLYMTDDGVMGQPIDNTNTKGDSRDANLFESYQVQQGKETRGRDRYADMSRGIAPKFKDNTKYQKVTTVAFEEKILEKSQKLRGKEYKPPNKRRQNLPFRKQIVSSLIAGARRVGLTTNLHVIAAEADFSDSNLKTRIKNSIDQKQFEKIRKDFMSKPDKLATTLQYADFDIILMKTNANVAEGQYYSAFLKELGNSLTFQELEKSLKVPAIRKKLLEAYEKILKGKNVPPSYTNDETGFENFVADQFGVAIRKELGIDVDGTIFDKMNAPTQAWFKRLVKNQKKMYDQSKTYRKRTEVDESFQEYSAELQEKLLNAENQQVPYTTKAGIETMIESVLGPETATDKQLRKLLEQSDKLFKSKKLPTWLQKVLLTSDTRLRNYGPIGVEIADFFNLDPRTVSKSGRAGIFTLKTRRANALHNKAAKILGVEDGWIYSSLSSEQRAIVNEAADDTKDTSTLSPKAQEIRKFLQEVYTDLNLNSYGVDERNNFFPRVVAVAEIAGNESLQIIARQVLKQANSQASEGDIANAVNNIVKQGAGELDFNPQNEIDIGMMKQRKELWSNVTNKQLIDSGLALPAEVGLQQYLDKVALKFEFEQSGGTKKLSDLMDKLTPEEQVDAKNIIDSMFGKTPPIDKGWLKTANNILLPVNVITLLAFTVLASLQDTAGPVLRSRGTAKISDIANVIKTMVKDPQQAAELAREVGVIGVDAMSSFFIFAGEQNFMNQTAKGVSDTWFRVTLLEAYTKFTRVFATGMGVRFLQDSARKAKKGDAEAQLYLNELNVTADEVLAWEEGKANKATREKVNEALAQFVDESIVRPNPAQRPTYANNPRYALIWQLKSFFYAYGKTIVYPTLKESHRNFVSQGAGAGVMPLLMMAGILLPITMLGLEIRELTKYLLAEALPGIDGDDPGVNYFKTNSMSTGQYMTEIIDRSGMLGPLALALPIFSARHRYGQPFWVPPLGPAAEKIYDGITWDWRGADYIPGYSQLDTRNLGR